MSVRATTPSSDEVIRPRLNHITPRSDLRKIRVEPRPTAVVRKSLTTSIFLSPLHHRPSEASGAAATDDHGRPDRRAGRSTPGQKRRFDNGRVPSKSASAMRRSGPQPCRCSRKRPPTFPCCSSVARPGRSRMPDYDRRYQSIANGAPRGLFRFFIDLRPIANPSSTGGSGQLLSKGTSVSPALCRPLTHLETS